MARLGLSRTTLISPLARADSLARVTIERDRLREPNERLRQFLNQANFSCLCYLMWPSVKSRLFSSQEYSINSEPAGIRGKTLTFVHGFVKVLGSSTVTS